MNSDVPSADEIAAMSDQERKVLENRLRRAAQRQGLRLEKSPLRDPRALGYGTYRLADPRADDDDTGRGYGLRLRDVALQLYGQDTRPETPAHREPTTVGRRTVENLALTLNSLAQAVQRVDSDEVDPKAMADQLNGVLDDVATIRRFVEKVISNGR
ncbi:hypothetical protein GR927_46600 [Mycolicibacterium sp. 3033]|nr:hypothetical protein [Mycolicibacterium aurantiacum]